MESIIPLLVKMNDRLIEQEKQMKEQKIKTTEIDKKIDYILILLGGEKRLP